MRALAYDGAALRAAEDARAARVTARAERYRVTFVDGPVLRIPLRDARYSFNPNLVVPLPGAGSVYGDFGLTGWFGTLEAPDGALLSADFTTVTVAAPPNLTTTTTPAWTLRLAKGCALKPDVRPHDVTIECAP